MKWSKNNASNSHVDVSKERLSIPMHSFNALVFSLVDVPIDT